MQVLPTPHGLHGRVARVLGLLRRHGLSQIVVSLPGEKGTALIVLKLEHAVGLGGSGLAVRGQWSPNLARWERPCERHKLN